jgi:hypothetical protein
MDGHLYLFELAQSLQLGRLLAARCRFLEQTEAPGSIPCTGSSLLHHHSVKPSRWLTQPYIAQGSMDGVNAAGA